MRRWAMGDEWVAFGTSATVSLLFEHNGAHWIVVANRPTIGGMRERDAAPIETHRKA